MVPVTREDHSAGALRTRASSNTGSRNTLLTFLLELSVVSLELRGAEGCPRAQAVA
jgi:hypothetical protein